MSDETESKQGKSPSDSADKKGRTMGDVAADVYGDIRPVVLETGKGLTAIAKSINAILVPIADGSIWASPRVVEFVKTRVRQTLQRVPEARIQNPDPMVAGPALQALQFVIDKKDLREMYANLLEAAMDTATAGNVLPVFADKIRLMSSDEAMIMAFFSKMPTPIEPVVNLLRVNNKDDSYSIVIENYSHIGKTVGCKNTANIRVYLDNLCHLGLLQIPEMAKIKKDKIYLPLESDPEMQTYKTLITQAGGEAKFRRKSITLTNFGFAFCQICIPQGNAKK